MKAIITGSTGMIGKLILNKCLQSANIQQVVSLVRRPTVQMHAKLTEVVVDNFEDYSNHETVFEGVDIAFFCLGAYTGQVSNDALKTITVNYAVAFAAVVAKYSPNATFCLLSGAGADRTETSKTPFALYKGMAENQIAQLNLNFYSFRPGYIYPVEPRKEPNLFYSLLRVCYPVLKPFFKAHSITSTVLANAMFKVGLQGATVQVLENKDILDYK